MEPSARDLASDSALWYVQQGMFALVGHGGMGGEGALRAGPGFIRIAHFSCNRVPDGCAPPLASGCFVTAESPVEFNMYNLKYPRFVADSSPKYSLYVALASAAFE